VRWFRGFRTIAIDGLAVDVSALQEARSEIIS
jgi:hypothetical protein